MNVILTVLIIFLIFKLSFGVLPRLIGFAFSFLFGFIGITLLVCILPFLGLLFFSGDIIILLLLLFLIRGIRS